MMTGDMKVSIDTGSGLLSHLIKYFILFTFGSSDVYIVAGLLMASIVHSFQYPCQL